MRNKPDVVKTGGVAKDEADTEDVTRDTYGSARPPRVRQDRDQRIAEADRAAESVGIPGVDIPEASEPSEERRRAEEFRRAEVAGNHTAHPRDAAKLRRRRRR